MERPACSIETTEDFRKYGKEMIDFIADYYDSMKTKAVTPDVSPGYINDILEDHAPEKSRSFQEIIDTFNKAVTPGLSQWQSPRFHAYYPTGSSFPSMLGSLLGEAIGCAGFSWIANPACTELETVTMDWLVDMLQLPKHFKHSSNGDGGGLLISSASEAAFISIITAKQRAIASGNYEENHFVAYFSSEAHSSIERALRLANVTTRVIGTSNCVMDAGHLFCQIETDIKNGFVPIFVCATLGTTSTCAFDKLDEIGEICNRYPVVWFHVDAAYAGSSFICPELRHLNKGVEYADSYLVNVSKWLLVSIECSAFYFKHSKEFTEAYKIDPVYLKNVQEVTMPDFRNWQIPLSRNFRSLKLWMVIMSYGVEGLRSHIRYQISLAKYFEELIEQDSRFEIINKVTLGLVCFRLKKNDDFNKELLARINEARNIYLCPSVYKGMFFIRFCVCSRLTTFQDIQYSWQEIQRHATCIKENKEVD